MKFNRRLTPEVKELLTTQYETYIKETPMSKKEKRVLREWVQDGHSVYENTSDLWADGQIPIEFLSVYRDEEYIRQHTMGMDCDEAHQFELAYYGFENDDEEAERYFRNTMDI